MSELWSTRHEPANGTAGTKRWQGLPALGWFSLLIELDEHCGFEAEVGG